MKNGTFLGFPGEPNVWFSGDIPSFVFPGFSIHGSPENAPRLNQAPGREGFSAFLQLNHGKQWKSWKLVGGFSPTHLNNMRKSNWIISSGRGENKIKNETTT